MWLDMLIVTILYTPTVWQNGGCNPHYLIMDNIISILFCFGGFFYHIFLKQFKNAFMYQTRFDSVWTMNSDKGITSKECTTN